MQSEERTFLLRLSIRAELTEELLEDDDFDERAWWSEWDGRVRPAVVRAVFQALRSFSGWSAHARSRGAAPEDELEIVVRRSYGSSDRAEERGKLGE